MENLKTFLEKNILDKNGNVAQGKFRFLSEEQKIEIFNTTKKCKSKKLTERIWWILNDIQDYPKVCKHLECKKPVRFRGGKYVGDFCSMSCKAKYQLTIKPNPFSGENGIKIRKEGMLKKYGVEHNMQMEKYLNARKETYIKKYGVDHPLKNNDIKRKIRNLNENNKIWLQIEKVNDYELYKRSVNKFTKKQNLQQLKNYNLRGHSKDLNSHHLDHKFSIHSGFNNNIPAHIIVNIVNLEILSQAKNIEKRTKCSITQDELFEMFYKNFKK